MKILDQLCVEMMKFDQGNPHNIQHFTKVHAYCALIGRMEGIAPETQLILEAAAYVHDIGIKPALERYGSSMGKYQEKLGPDYAREMLARLGMEQKVIDRVAYLVGHHHTYDKIDGMDYQILVEADFLVNLHEGNSSEETIWKTYEKIFVTESGKHIFREMFQKNKKS